MNILFLRFSQKLFTIAAVLGVCSVANAQSLISTDGTTGRAGIVNFYAPGAQNVVIDGAAHGTQQGSNLFFSFSQFNIATGDSALFQCPSCNGVANVISRVTGHHYSTFNGPLISTIGTANFWFFNPVGVSVNSTVSVPVSASYYISNAAKVNLSDGSAFDVETPINHSSLITAPPADFGFANSMICYAIGTNDATTPKVPSTLVQAIQPLTTPPPLLEHLPPCDNHEQSSLLAKGVANYIPTVSSQVPYSVLGTEEGAAESVEQSSELSSDECHEELANEQ